MTTYLGEKAVGVGTVKATMSVGKVITDDKTILGDGFAEPLAVNTLLFATSESVAASAEAVRTEFNNKLKVVDSAIDGQAEAIAKTRNDFEVADQEIRADMNEKDSELEHMITEHAEELTTLRGNQASLGDQVSNIESKIPQSASGSNPLITKQQLLDEEMDIRDDYNELVSELQTQITAQAGAIAGKQDELVAGTGIKIDGNVISATGGGGSGSANVVHDSTLTGAGTSASPLGLSESVKDEIADKAPKETVEALTTAVNDINTVLADKQDKLTAGENITIEDGVISATGGGGDYLPLSGGTMTGVLNFDYNSGPFDEETLITFSTHKGSLNVIRTGQGGSGLIMEIPATSSGVKGRYQLAGSAFAPNDSGPKTLGTILYGWENVYTKKLNNGADIAVPTSGGTMVVATPPTEDGSYVLKCVVVDGVPTVSWVKE